MVSWVTSRCDEGFAGLLAFLIGIVVIVWIVKGLRWLLTGFAAQWTGWVVQWSCVVLVLGALAGVLYCKLDLRRSEQRQQQSRAAQRAEHRARTSRGRRSSARSTPEANDRVQILNTTQAERTPDVQAVLILLSQVELDAAKARDYDTAAITVRRIKFIHESSIKLEHLTCQARDAVLQEDFPEAEAARKKEEAIRVALRAKLKLWSNLQLALPDPAYYSPTCCPPEDDQSYNPICAGEPPPLYTSVADEPLMGVDSDVERRGSRDSNSSA